MKLKKMSVKKERNYTVLRNKISKRENFRAAFDPGAVLYFDSPHWTMSR